MYLGHISSHLAPIIFLRKGDVFPLNTSVAKSISVVIHHPMIAFFLFWSDLVSSKQKEKESKRKRGIAKTPIEQGNGR